MEANKVKKILAGLCTAALVTCLGLAAPALAGDNGKGRKAGQRQGQGLLGGEATGGSASVAGQGQGQGKQKNKAKSGRYEWLVPAVEVKNSNPDRGGGSK